MATISANRIALRARRLRTERSANKQKAALLIKLIVADSNVKICTLVRDNIHIGEQIFAEKIKEILCEEEKNIKDLKAAMKKSAAAKEANNATTI